ncbi:MAG: hypothetical protein JWR26_1479 [Pedosphaera sp.]|nr:hypothetical protein [Pedosphaera sp.]
MVKVEFRFILIATPLCPRGYLHGDKTLAEGNDRLNWK